MFDFSSPPDNPKSLPPRRRPPTHTVYQLVEAEGQIYKMKVGSGWKHADGNDVHRIVTIHGEFEINKLHGNHAIH